MLQEFYVSTSELFEIIVYFTPVQSCLYILDDTHRYRYRHKVKPLRRGVADVKGPQALFSYTHTQYLNLDL